MAVKSNLRVILAERDIKVIDLAASIGTDAGQVSKWSKGRVTPSLEMALRLARELDCRVEDIFELEPLG